MADSSVLTDIRTMIDLAIGTPEVGVVDFCMLHTVLHCLAQQLHVLDKPVELHGSASSLPSANQLGKEGAHTIAITEYLVETDTTTPVKTVKPGPVTAEPPSLLVVERVKKDTSPDRITKTTITKTTVRTTESVRTRRDSDSRGGGGQSGEQGADGQGSGGQEGEDNEDRYYTETITSRAEPRVMTSSEKLSLVTLSKFNVLEDKVQDLKDRVYGSMPKNEQILQEVRSQTNMKAITDMWTNLNVSSRLEAAEAGLSKLSSLVEDLIKEGSQRVGASPGQALAAPVLPAAGTPAAGTPSAGTPAAGTPAAGTLAPAAPADVKASEQSRFQEQQQYVNPLAQFGPPYPWETMASELYDERVSVLAQLERLRGDIDTLNKAFYGAMQNLQDGLDPKEAASMVVTAAASAKPSPPPPPPPPPPAQPPPPVPQFPPVAQYPPQSTPMATADGRGTSGASAALADRLAQLEKRIKECCDGMGKDKGTVQDQLNNFQNQLEHLAHQVANLHDDFGALKISPNLAKDLEGLMKLYQTVQDMQEQLRQVNDTARLLAGEKDDRQHHMNALLEQIEILKTIKMDREDMAEAMAEKADVRLLARKVSHDQFEMACDDLSRGLEHALGKLNTQESLWQQVLDDIQREIETKLDKMELSPLKDFFNNKLRQLQDNLKEMASLRRDVEAAGTRRRLLRDVNCISCDANAVMAMDNTGVATSKPLPAHLSMKPYLSYELDAIRKTQASNLPHRNLHDWETIDKQMAPSKPPVRVRSATDKHICNRYCGGSHTTTTPAQRVARLGHFIKQWGPDVVPLSSGLAAGDDGKLYKVSTAEHANVGPAGPVDQCTKKPKLPEPSKPAPKPILPTPECRCCE